MKPRLSCPYAVLALALIAVSPRAHAQWAVIDVQALVQLMQQVQTLNQTLNTARGELAQAQQEFQSMTGSRGMQNLLSGTVRNYLPSSLSGLTATLAQVNTGNSGLAAAVQAALAANAVLTPQQLALLPPDLQARVSAWRSTAALLQGITGSALANSSGRFAAIQQLIDTIGAAPDQKSVLELAARIDAESGMLQNEQTKLQSLYQVAQAQHWVNEQQERETALAEQGQFSSRFEPVP